MTKLSGLDITISMEHEWLSATLSPSLQFSLCLLTYTVDDRYCGYITQVTLKINPKVGFIFDVYLSLEKIFQLPCASFSLETFLSSFTL
jgi:hypothetical protein